MKNIFIRCPECESKEYHKIGERWSDSYDPDEIDMYECNKCGCEFDEEEADDDRRDEEEFGD